MTKRVRAESRARYYIRDQSSKRGWKIQHPNVGGDCLEEQEILSHFPDMPLGAEKPDFLFCLNGEPCLVIEAKNSIDKIEQAIKEATEYADKINQNNKYDIRIAVGAAGEEDCGFSVVVKYLKNGSWNFLKSNGYEITTIPSKKEVELALIANDSTTNVQVPSVSEFIDAAIELSRILRHAKVETILRPKVIGAIVLAIYQGEIDMNVDSALSSINKLVSDAIDESVDLSEKKKIRLKESLKLSGSDYDRLSPFISRIVSILKRLNIRSVLQTDVDFLGLFYEAFLRYGYDNNALGIVFTPRHMTRFCADLVDVDITDRVIDVACGTGGFLVAAFDKMLRLAHGPKAIQKAKNSIYGFDTNPTIWALSTLNMFFRGDGKSNIENSSCFDKENTTNVQCKFTRAFLNPPFSQEGEPERDFIDVSMQALEPEGLLAVLVKAGIFADDDNKSWRKEFTRKHAVLGVISLPEDLFYPTSAPTSIMIAKAHVPQKSEDKIFMARIWNDGFSKLKGRRVEVEGSQLTEIKEAFKAFQKSSEIQSNIVTLINGSDIMGGNEWSPQQWLPQPIINAVESDRIGEEVVLELYRTIAAFPDLADIVIENFVGTWSDLPELELNKSASTSHFFHVLNGKSSGEKNYREGGFPYISSGDTTSSIIRLVDSENNQLFKNGGITVTAFGQAHIQPWPFLARGNGGSAVRILIPKYNMSLNELIWFTTQINIQRWRFFYARMSIKSRLERLNIKSPNERIPDNREDISLRLRKFRDQLIKLSKIK